MLIFVLICSFFLSEGTCRILFKQALQVPKNYPLFYEHDPLLGWRKVPNASGVYITASSKVFKKFNSKGIAGPEYQYAKDGNEYRILILGDSFAEGETIEFEQSFSEVLKRRLNENGARFYEVINAGTKGYSTDQELLFYKKEGVEYRPDLTILMFYENDVWYNSQPKYLFMHKPLFRMLNGKLTLTNVPVPGVSGFKEGRHSFKQGFYLYRFVCNFLKRLRRETAGVPEEFLVWQDEYSYRIKEAWGLTEAIIGEFKKTSDNIKSPLLIFYVPSSKSIYPEEWLKTRIFFGLFSDGWNVNRPAIELERICRNMGIELLNPSDLFKLKAGQLKKAKKRLYSIEDPHWTLEGHDFVADVLFQYLKSTFQ
ncbi:MAG: SGNH/GDSL hydrolase family protein [Candidatus Omnitrophota bacterium]